MTRGGFVEIGSEFWMEDYVNTIDSNLFSDEIAILLSGRSALDYVCRDSLIKSILLPSYCCTTMIEPFLRNGVNVSFYDVDIDAISYPSNDTSDAVLVIDYFGFKNVEMERIAKKAFKERKIVIYDKTHRLSSNIAIEKYSTYSISSYRKWMYCNFATVRKFKENFCIEQPKKCNDEYLFLRNEAAQLKHSYILNETTDKTQFLQSFQKANELLQNDYVGYAGVPIAFNKKAIVKQRRDNAQTLINGMLSIPNAKLWKTVIAEDDTPLFLPILLKDADERKRLRDYLVRKNIYCPIHWPQNELTYKTPQSLYQRELSLICDQRYGTMDMEKQISAIKEFFR